MGDVVVVYEKKRKRGQWKMGVVESLVTGRDGIVRGASVRVVTKGKPVHLSRPVQKLYPFKIRSEGEVTQTSNVCIQALETPTRNVPPRSTALDTR